MTRRLSTDGRAVIRLPTRLGSEPLATKYQLAEHLQVHPKTIERRVQAGMPCVRIGQLVRFRIAECEAWLEAQG
jgi:excisionase family DNA binding protein